MRSFAPSAPANLALPARRSSYFPVVLATLFLLTFLGSYKLAQVQPSLLFEAEGRRNIWKFVAGMFPPDLSWSFLSLLGRPILETIQISVMGTAVAVAIGFPLGLLATSTLTFKGILNERELAGSRPRAMLRKGTYLLARAVLSLFRTIPEFVWAFKIGRASCRERV